MDVNFASKAVGGTALGLAIGAGALALNNASGGGLLGGLFGGGNHGCDHKDSHDSVAAMAGMLSGLFSGVGNTCSDNMTVNRYELNQQKEITNRDMEIAFLKGRDAAKTDSLELYKYVDGRFRGVEAQIAAQAVVNAQITANISCMQNSIAALNGLTKTVIPIGNVCPEPMPAYNSWTAPTAAATT